MRIEKTQQYLKGNNLDAILIESPTNRRYISGFTGTFGTVLITKEKAVFITDFRYTEQARAEAKGFIVVENRNTTEEVFKQAAENEVKTMAFEEDLTSYQRYKTLSQQEKFQLKPVSGVVEKMRMFKTEEELAHIRMAAKISDEAFERILKDLKPGVSEFTIRNKLEMYMREAGATSSSFDMIIASGHRSALPHGVASEKIIEMGDMVTLDFGALYKGYCSDMTRTIAIGEPNPTLKEVYQIVKDALALGIHYVKDGVDCKDLDAVVRDYITEKGYGEAFGHGTGHSYGLEIHEGPYFAVTSDETIQTGMVMTIEPGIYLPGLGGVRIEDDVLVTESGCEILTKSPKELIVL